jgi:DtxR family Mn-dependent transcriptional regulator
MDHVDDLTPIAQDYLKVIWSAIEWGDPPITTKLLAARFATTQANVSETMRRLDRQGLVNYQPYKPVTLTSLGESLAVAMVRRHRLLETYLAQALNYGWEEVHDEAERLEHAVSDGFLERIDHLLGYPRIDPHGDPIPGPHWDWTPQTGAIKLSQAEPGQYRVVRVADTDPEQLSRLRREHLEPGSTVQVRAGLPPVIVGAPSPAGIDPADMDAVRVRPA